MANPFDAFKDILNEETPTPAPPDTSYVKSELPEVPIEVNPFSAFEDILKDKEVNAPTEAEQSNNLTNTDADTLMLDALEAVEKGNGGILEQETIEDIDFRKASKEQYSPPPIDIVDLTPEPVELPDDLIKSDNLIKPVDIKEELKKQISSSLGKDVSIDSMKNVISEYGGYVDTEKESLNVKMTVDEKGNLEPKIEQMSTVSDLFDPGSDSMKLLHKAFPLFAPYDKENFQAGVTETLEKEGYLNESQKVGTYTGTAYPISLYLKAMVHRALGSDPEAMYEQPEDIVDTYKGVTSNVLATILNLPFIPLEMADHVWSDVQASNDPINTALGSTAELTGEILKYFAHSTVNASLAISPFSTEEQQAEGRAALYEDPMGPIFTIMGGYGGVKTAPKIKKSFKEAPAKVQTAGNNLMAAYHYYRTGTKAPKELQPFIDILNTNPNAPGIARNLINALEGVKDLKKPKAKEVITAKQREKIDLEYSSHIKMLKEQLTDLKKGDPKKEHSTVYEGAKDKAHKNELIGDRIKYLEGKIKLYDEAPISFLEREMKSRVESFSSRAQKLYDELTKPKVETKKNVGYQSGKGPSKIDNINMGYGRGTGHFGSGTYFFGNKESAIKHSKARGKRPITEIDLSGKKLFRPFEMTRAVGKNKDGSPIKNTFPAGGNFGMANELHQMLKKVNDASYGIETYTPSQIKGISDRLNRWTGLKSTSKMIESVIQEVKTEIKSVGGNYSELKTETASTRLMRKLGYDGIDMRGVKGFDNSAYGSVIYSDKPNILDVSKSSRVEPKVTPKIPIKTKTPKKLKESTKPLEEQKSILDKEINKIEQKKVVDGAIVRKLTKEEKSKSGVLLRKLRNVEKKIEFNKKSLEERKQIIRKQGKLEYEITEIKNALKEQKEFLEPREITSKKETITEKLKEVKLLERELKKLEPKGKTTELHGGFGLAKREISEFTNYIKNKIRQGDKNLGTIYNSYFNEKNKNFSEYGLVNEIANKVLVLRDRDGNTIDYYSLPRNLRKTPESSKFLDLRNKFIGDGMKIKHEVSNLIDVISRYEQKDKNIVMEYLEGKTDISNIKDVKLQRVAKIVRHRLDNYGKQLVDAGLISKESYLKHKGEYLANIYAAHWVGKSPTQTGVPKIRKDYNNHRAGVSESRKLELGERVSLETSIYESIIREKNDLLTAEFLNQILENPKWAKKESIIEVGGKKYGEIALETELANVNAVISKKKANKQPVPKETQQHANNLQKALDAHRKKVSEAEVLLQEYNAIVAKEKRGDKLTKDQQDILDAGPPSQFTSPDFVKIQGQGYGNLNGVLVDKGIAENLQVLRGEQWGADWMKKRETSGTPWIAKDRLINGYINFTNTFKAAKVPFNLPTVSRNMFSTSLQLNQAGMSLTQQIKVGPSIIKSMRSKDKSYMEALENGLFKGTITTEYFQFLEKYTKNLTQTTKRGDSYLNAIWDATKEFSGKKAKNVTDFYGAIDNFYKFMHYKHLRNQGKGVKESVRTAQDVVIDYSLISPTMAAMRQHPVIGMPFITYTRKILPRTIQSIRENPMRSTAIIGLPILYSQVEFSKYTLQLQNENFDEDTWDLMQVAMGERMRENGIVLPFFDSEGRPQVMDLTYNLPWGSWQEVGRSLISLFLGDSDDIIGSLQEVGGGISNNFGLMPGPSMYMAIKFGIIPTAGGGYMEIYDMLDSPADRAISVAQFTRNLVLPGMLNENGALDKTLETAGIKQTNIYDTKLTSLQAAARWIGINIYPVDIGMGTLKQTKKFTYLIGELHRAFNRELTELKTTQGIEDVDKLKDDILQRYIPKMMQIYDDIYSPIIEKRLKEEGFDSLREKCESKLGYGKEENYDESWEDYQKRKKKAKKSD